MVVLSTTRAKFSFNESVAVEPRPSQAELAVAMPAQDTARRKICRECALSKAWLGTRDVALSYLELRGEVARGVHPVSISGFRTVFRRPIVAYVIAFRETLTSYEST